MESTVDALMLELRNDNRKDVSGRLKAALDRDPAWGDLMKTCLVDDVCAVCGPDTGTRASRYCEWVGGKDLPNYGRNDLYRKRWRRTQPAFNKAGFNWQRKGCCNCCQCQECLRRAEIFLLRPQPLQEEMDVDTEEEQIYEDGIFFGDEHGMLPPSPRTPPLASPTYAASRRRVEVGR